MLDFSKAWEMQMRRVGGMCMLQILMTPNLDEAKLLD